MKLILISVMFFFSFCAFSAETEVSTQETLNLNMKMEKEKPLMVIRLNKEQIFYQNSLEKLVKKAVSIKNTIKFYLDIHTKVTGDKVKDAALRKESQEKSYQIGVDIMSFGADQNNIFFNYYETKDIPSNEIHIFVK